MALLRSICKVSSTTAKQQRLSFSLQTVHQRSTRRCLSSLAGGSLFLHEDYTAIAANVQVQMITDFGVSTSLSTIGGIEEGTSTTIRSLQTIRTPSFEEALFFVLWFICHGHKQPYSLNLSSYNVIFFVIILYNKFILIIATQTFPYGTNRGFRYHTLSVRRSIIIVVIVFADMHQRPHRHMLVRYF